MPRIDPVAVAATGRRQRQTPRAARPRPGLRPRRLRERTRGRPNGPSSQRAYGSTAVCAVAVLFAVFGSGGEVALTVAVLVIVPLLVGLTTIVLVTVAPLAMVPRSHVTVDFDGFAVQPGLADAKPAFFGRLSVTVTPVAAFGPLFVTVIV